MWHYFFGKMQKPQKLKTLHFEFFELCGIMWRYVALFLGKCKNLKNLKNKFFEFFELCGIMWRYVALCGTIFGKMQKPQTLKELSFLSFLNFVALCGAMWHYFWENAKTSKT